EWKARMNQKPANDWDPRDPAILSDQRDAYDAMRERCPVAHSDFLGWSLFHHDDLVAVLADPKTYSSASHHRAVPNGMDPPEHTEYRKILEPFFTPDQMRAFEPACRKVAIDLVRSLLGSDIEFIGTFAHPFTLKVHCAFLGWPLEVWEHLHGWTHGNQDAGLARDRTTGAALAREFGDLVEEAIAIRRNAGVDASADLTSHLMDTEIEGNRLSDDDIVSILRNWTAGQGTVAAGIAILVQYLAEHPDLQTMLRAKPDRLPDAINEILRVDGPLVANRRTTTRAVEIGGRKIEAGEKLTLMWIAANRDNRVFDDATEVRLDRDQSANYLFGAGIHVCVGAELARLEMRVALEELLARTTVIELGSSAPSIRAVYPSNGYQSLPVRLR
ncbi:MAG TPA: cytochrome P450, partial [Thermomicrobiales bacterium]|nr:cytochrome P450 [Thermomicrobiales bacterium]